ncbi:MAG: GAF domain-containing protein [Caulobacteraceae bacterium]
MANVRTERAVLSARPTHEKVEDEAARLDAVRRYEILDSAPEGSFDRLTAVAARLFGVPVAGVSIVDQDRIWFKSRQGLPLAEVARAPGLCGSTILGVEPYVLTDAARDPRARDHPLVAGEFGIRFYAGAPLRTPDGHNLGALFVIDTAPRSIRRRDRDHLQDLAAVAMDQLELRLAAHRRDSAPTHAPRSLAWKTGASASPNRLRLADWRKSRGLTGVELARRSGLSASYISFLEHGRRRYNKDTLHALSKALHCSAAQLLEEPPFW